MAYLALFVRSALAFGRTDPHALHAASRVTAGAASQDMGIRAATLGDSRGDCEGDVTDEEKKLIRAIRQLIAAADSGEWHFSSDCKVEQRNKDCKLCQAILEAKSVIKQVRRFHYLIIGGYTHKPIGCTWGEDGKAQVLEEEPRATFQRIAKRSCPVCNH